MSELADAIGQIKNLRISTENNQHEYYTAVLKNVEAKLIKVYKGENETLEQPSLPIEGKTENSSTINSTINSTIKRETPGEFLLRKGVGTYSRKNHGINSHLKPRRYFLDYDEAVKAMEEYAKLQPSQVGGENVRKKAVEYAKEIFKDEFYLEEEQGIIEPYAEMRIEGFIEGYKQGASCVGYSDEQMRNAMLYASIQQSNTTDIEKYLKSFTPSPIVLPSDEEIECQIESLNQNQISKTQLAIYIAKWMRDKWLASYKGEEK